MSRWHDWLFRATVKQARRLVVAVVGGTVLLLGIVMIVTPGPAFLVIPLGLAILASEFVWAKRLLKRVRSAAGEIIGNRKDSGGTQTPPGR